MNKKKMSTVWVLMFIMMIFAGCGSSKAVNAEEVYLDENEMVSENETDYSADFSGDNAKNLDAPIDLSSDVSENDIEDISNNNPESDGEVSENDILINNIDEASEDDSSDVSADEVASMEVSWDDIEACAEPATKYVTSDKLNVRKGPDKAFDLVGVLVMNTEVHIIGKSKTTPWVEIMFNNEKAFIHSDYLGDSMVNMEELLAKAKEEEEAKALEQAQLAEAQRLAEAARLAEEARKAEEAAKAAELAARQPVIKNPAKTLFIGDSRTCQMRDASGSGKCTWLCEYGSKYDWFESTAIPAADTMVGKGTRVVICMGVNDPDNCGSYAALVNQKAADWNARGAVVYYVSVNPVEPPYDFKTDSIEAFNSSMPGRLSGVRWIDTASQIKKGGYVFVDGIHFDSKSSANIYAMIMNSL